MKLINWKLNKLKPKIPKYKVKYCNLNNKIKTSKAKLVRYSKNSTNSTL